MINEIGGAEMQIGSDERSSRKCHGDSGGPTYLRVETESSRKERTLEYCTPSARCGPLHCKQNKTHAHTTGNRQTRNQTAMALSTAMAAMNYTSAAREVQPELQAAFEGKR